MAKFFNRFLFFILEVLVVVYFYRTASFWMNALTFDESEGDSLRYILLAIIEALAVGLLFVNGKFNFRGIHAICFLWLFFIAIALLVAKTTFKIYFYCFAWPLLFEATYLLVRDKKKRVKHIVRLYFIVAAIGLWVFLQSMLYQSFGSQSNMIYFFALTVPILLLKENKTWRSVVLIFTTVMVVLSMKRSMMLAMVLFWVLTGIVYFIRGRKNKIQVFIIGIVMAFVGFYSVNYVNRLSGGFMTERFEMEDMSNGREGIYAQTWLMQLNSTPGEWVLGHGHDAVRKDSQSISAHNEWLEILYDYGIIIVVLYLCLWICLIRRWFFLYKTESKCLIAYTLSLSILAVMSMVSQLVLYVSYFLYLVMFWAMIEALNEKEFYLRRHKKRQKHPTRRQERQIGQQQQIVERSPKVSVYQARFSTPRQFNPQTKQPRQQAE